MADPKKSQYGTSESEDIQQQAFFAYAAPADIHKLYRERTRPDPEGEFYGFHRSDQISEQAEGILVDRNEPLIDTTLALWGENEHTCRRIYQRWFPADCVWPPQNGSPGHWVLHSLLSNRHQPLTEILRDRRPDDYFRRERARISAGESAVENPPLLSTVRFISALSNPDHQYLAAICLNPAGLEHQLNLFSSVEANYRELPTEIQARCTQYFACNERFLRIRKDGLEGPDFNHNVIHRAFLKSIAALPKEDLVAAILCSTLEYVPGRATRDAWVRDEVEVATDAWDFDLPIGGEDNQKFWESKQLGDDLTPTERIRFHIWRLYPDDEKLKSDSADKVRRLAFYASAKINKRVESADNNKVMRYGDITQYALRDGLNFKFATCYNPYIWGNDSEDGTTIASAIQSVLPSVDERRADHLSDIIRQVIRDEELRREKDLEYRDEMFERDEEIRKGSDADRSRWLLKQVTEQIVQLRTDLTARLAGWEKAILVVVFIWLAGLIWRSL